MALIASDLIASVRDRCDMPDEDGLVTNAMILQYLNAELAEIYDLIVLAFEDYFVKKVELVVAGGAESADLPEDFFKDRQVFAKTGTKRDPLRRFHLADIDKFQTVYCPNTLRSQYPEYRIIDNQVYLSPLSSTSCTLELWYVPRYQKLLVETDTVKFTVPQSGWEEAAIQGAAAQCLAKGDDDPRECKQKKAEIMARIKALTPERDAGEANVIRDVYGRNL